MTLTEEQRARIEENKLRALRLRREKARHSSPRLHTPINQRTGFSAGVSVSSHRWTSISGRGVSSVGNICTCPQQQQNEGGGGSVGSPYVHNRIVGSGASCEQWNGQKYEVGLELVSKTHFKATTKGYSQCAVDVFRSVEGREYKQDTQEWHFPLTSYSTLLKSMNQPLFTVEQLPKAVVETFIKKDYFGFRGLVHSAEEESQIDFSSLDPYLNESLLPYQREGVIKAVTKFNGRVLLADDMGLGKTIQAIAIAFYYRMEFPALIIAPASVRYDWKSALLKWAPSLLTESDVQVLGMKNEPLSETASFFIISYEMISKKIKSLADAKFQIVICDECHNLKNAKADRTKKAIPLIENAGRRILLSGTPALSRPAELFTQARAICPRLFPPSIFEFGKRYCEGKMTQFGWNFSGASHLHELQLLLEERIMIRRLKSDVLKGLPKKTRKQIMIKAAEVDSFERKALQEIVQKGKEVLEAKDRIEKHSALCQVFGKSAETKLPAVLEYITKFLRQCDDKVLILAHHKIVMDGICHLLDRLKVSHVKIDGATPSKERFAACNTFRAVEDCRVCVLSIMVAPGLTLTSASTAIFTELFWNPGALLQAEDRIHRIGQENGCTILYLLCSGTIDDHMWPLVSRKLDVLSDVGLSEKENGLAWIDSVEVEERTFAFSSNGNRKENSEMASHNEGLVMDDFFEQWKAEQTKPEATEKEKSQKKSKGAQVETPCNRKRLKLCDIAACWPESQEESDFAWDFDI